MLKPTPPDPITIVIFSPRDRELAVFVEDALAFKPVEFRTHHVLPDAVAALGDGAHAMIVDIDGMSTDDTRGLHAAIADAGWSGSIIAVGNPSAEQREVLPIDHVLASRVTSVELRGVLAAVTRQARTPKTAVPMRT